MMVTHIPLPDAHAVHGPLQLATLQQKPSLHVPVVHWAFVVHAPPGLVLATQVFEALQ
jgi:hypothetical protein